ncbi:glycosyltransferase family 2 protein [Haloterrigena sp. SYSU A558-1]|uniref:Glycosyltransferase family 2 protein n=1 Tax=Haloterrigena gelatinilytica TaxID=2741724 RepID=A0ABX2LIS4_9EURY|nr:glycosyltransferase [Haloterrigena gelatinilytica]NUC75064.1 glycosyltransferase family 2 protein [Haloterrigena gelatinilytica]
MQPTPDQPQVSVVLSVAGPNDRLETAIDRLLAQTHTPEVVVTVDGAPDLAAYLADRYADTPVTIDHTPGATGLSAARNRGAATADGEIVAFTDADCEPAESWIDELVRCYEEYGAIAAGGPAVPEWPDDRPARVPPELEWLVGTTHRGFTDKLGIHEVRNTFGCNISFRAEVFEALGGFDERLGKRPGREIQGEEAELCARLHEQFDRGVTYNPDATVTHHVDDYQLERTTLLKRSYWQGRSKRVLADLLPDATDTEADYLSDLLGTWVPERLTRTVTDRSARPLVETAWLLAVTAAVATGYLTGGTGRPLETPTETTQTEASQ